MTKKRWKDHPIYECKVSDQGRVYGIKHTTISEINTGNGRKYTGG